MTAATPPRLLRLHHLTERWVTRLRPYAWLWPPMAFLIGALSFFLVDRQQALGVLLALGLLFAWLLLLSESMIGRILARRGYPTLPSGVTTFIAQMIHQETLFFTLPFLLATTVWASGQALFTLAMIGLALILGGAAWAGRAWVPPATLWLTGTALSPSFETDRRQPSGSLILTNSALRSQGLYAYTAIRAPRGLREKIYHEWRHEGQLIDRIPLIIHGGRDRRYRAWTHKQHFPEDSTGRWRIDVMTATGQRIGVMHFTVAESAERADSADGIIRTPVGIPGLDLRQLLPGGE